MSTKEIVLTIVFAIAAMSLLFAIVSRENYLYSWDSSGYWTRCIATENSFFTNPVKCITSVYTSINRDIYNNLLTLITIFPIKVFGTSRLSYILTCFCMFTIPTGLILSATAEKILILCGLGRKRFHMIFAVPMVFAGTYIAPLSGYIDAGAMLPIALLFLIIIGSDFKNFDLKLSISMAICVLWAVFARRYFAYCIIGLFLGAFVYTLCDLLHNNNLKFQTFFCLILNYAVAVGICFVMLVGLQLFYRQFAKLLSPAGLYIMI